MKQTGIVLISIGASVVLIGLLVLLADRLPWLGHLPGDFHMRGKHLLFSFPLVTCILGSVVLTVIVNIVLRLMHR